MYESPVKDGDIEADRDKADTIVIDDYKKIPGMINEVYKVVFADTDEKVEETVQAFMTNGQNRRQYHLIKPNAGLMELLDPSSDKADAIKAFCRAEGISMENTIAFGDGGNDIGMLKTVARGYCMENGEIETKRAAYKVVADNDHDGIAEGIHDCFEIDRQKEAPELKEL